MKKTKKAGSSMNTISPYDDQAWRARNDCDTLMEAERIRADPKRLKAARGAAKEKCAELEKTLAATQKLSTDK